MLKNSIGGAMVMVRNSVFSSPYGILTSITATHKIFDFTLNNIYILRKNSISNNELDVKLIEDMQ